MQAKHFLTIFVQLAIAFFASHASAQCIPQPDLEAVYKRAKPQEAKDAGFLWEIEKNGRISHLYGTIHILPESLVSPGRKTLLAFQNSNALALEIDILNPKTMAEFQAEIKLAPDVMKLNAAQKAEAMRIAKALCADKDMQNEQPWSLKYIQISMAKIRSLGYEPAFAREIFFSIVSQGSKKPVHSLETAKIQVKALTEGWDFPPALIDKFLADIENGAAERVMSNMLSIWSNNELEKLADLDSWCECKDDAFSKRLLTGLNDSRNPGMASELDRLHSSGKKVFAVIGALHMTGTYALPKLMEQKGYVVRRVF